jgi:anti-sigma factor RsiW
VKRGGGGDGAHARPLTVHDVTCDEVDEVLGAYSRDALTPARAAAVRSHLAGCPGQRARAAELRLAATALPPASLRERVLGAIAAEPPMSARAGDAIRRVPGADRPDGSRWRRWLRRALPRRRWR